MKEFHTFLNFQSIFRFSNQNSNHVPLKIKSYICPLLSAFYLKYFFLQCSTNEFNAIEVSNLTSSGKSDHHSQGDEEETIDLSCKEVPPPSKN